MEVNEVDYLLVDEISCLTADEIGLGFLPINEIGYLLADKFSIIKHTK